MRDGVIRETGSADQIFDRPADAYTAELLATVPRPAPV
jgi:ABC-type oligopeptide transport system ATPase subunit